MADVSNLFNGSMFCVITGACKGFGREMAVQVSNKMASSRVTFLITGRDLSRLDETKDLMQRNAPRFCVVAKIVDQGDFNEAEFERILIEGVGDMHVDHAIIINNAATLGDNTKKLSEMRDTRMITRYLETNLSSVLSMTGIFLKVFPRKDSQTRTVINVTSICALQPCKTASLYCAGKAASKMAFKCLAEEEPDLRVLSYSPGTMDTDMLQKARTSAWDILMRQHVERLYTDGKVLACATSAKKLISILEEDKFKSGEHVAFSAAYM